MIKDSLIVGFIVLILTTWAPWITTGVATRIVTKKFTAQWFGVMDGCVLNCDGCGIKKVQRTPFGVKVNIAYVCGVQQINSLANQKAKTIFVSFLGTVHGLKKISVQ